MTSRSIVDPELLDLLDRWPTGVMTPERLASARANPPPPQKGARPRGVARRDVIAPGPPGAPGLRLLVYKPTGEAPRRPAILHFHGGGYVLGSADGADLRNRRRAAELGCVVVSVDYRLAPETPHPGPVEDGYAALQWLHDAAADLEIDPHRIAVAGESAGGGLAAALALLTRDRGGPKIAFQMLVFPMLDDRTGSQNEPHPFAGEFIWTAGSNRFAWRCLLGREPGGQDTCPYAAPARARDLSGLPPAFLSIGSLDLFLEENLEYARRLTRCGVPVELHVYPGAYHAFQVAEGARVSRASEKAWVEALRRAFEAPRA